MIEKNDQTPQKLQLWMPLLLSLMMVGGMLIGIQLKPRAPQTKIVIENDMPSGQLGQGRIEELIRYIEAKYVDDVHSDEMVEKAINSLIQDLDPHSNYLSAEQVQEVNEQLQGNFKGIGVEFMLLDDTIVVVRPIEGGPAAKAGIIAGDKIVEISDTLIAKPDTEISEVMRMLRGEKGTKVKVGVLREGEGKLRTFMLKRDEIPVHSLDVATMIDDEVGYIKINRFSATTYREFMEGLENLVENEGMKDLIIDVRQNPGGYLHEATKILSQLFKEKDQLLVYTEGRAVHRNDYETTGQYFFDVRNIIVLIDEGSASASEILAGAIQDLDRGTIVGRRSFGKGLVQEQYQLKDGSALRLTVARYYTPSGRSIQRPYSDDTTYNDDLDARYHSGELVDAAKISRNDSLVYYTKTGRTVYGGGGITPDYFVPIDTLVFDNNYIRLQKHLSPFVYRYYRQHLADFEGMSLDSFVQKFDWQPDVVNDFIAYAASKDTLEEVTVSVKSAIQKDMKARLGKYAYDEEGFFTVLRTDDTMLQQALKLLRSPNQLVSENETPAKEKEF